MQSSAIVMEGHKLVRRPQSALITKPLANHQKPIKARPSSAILNPSNKSTTVIHSQPRISDTNLDIPSKFEDSELDSDEEEVLNESVEVPLPSSISPPPCEVYSNLVPMQPYPTHNTHQIQQTQVFANVTHTPSYNRTTSTPRRPSSAHPMSTPRQTNTHHAEPATQLTTQTPRHPRPSTATLLGRHIKEETPANPVSRVRVSSSNSHPTTTVITDHQVRAPNTTHEVNANNDTDNPSEVVFNPSRVPRSRSHRFMVYNPQSCLLTPYTPIIINNNTNTNAQPLSIPPSSSSLRPSSAKSLSSTQRAIKLRQSLRTVAGYPIIAHLPTDFTVSGVCGDGRTPSQDKDVMQLNVVIAEDRLKLQGGTAPEEPPFIDDYTYEEHPVLPGTVVPVQQTRARCRSWGEDADCGTVGTVKLVPYVTDTVLTVASPHPPISYAHCRIPYIQSLITAVKTDTPEEGTFPHDLTKLTRRELLCLATHFIDSIVTLTHNTVKKDAQLKSLTRKQNDLTVQCEQLTEERNRLIAEVQILKTASKTQRLHAEEKATWQTNRVKELEVAVAEVKRMSQKQVEDNFRELSVKFDKMDIQHQQVSSSLKSRANEAEQRLASLQTSYEILKKENETLTRNAKDNPTLQTSPAVIDSKLLQALLASHRQDAMNMVQAHHTLLNNPTSVGKTVRFDESQSPSSEPIVESSTDNNNDSVLSELTQENTQLETRNQELQKECMRLTQALSSLQGKHAQVLAHLLKTRVERPVSAKTRPSSDNVDTIDTTHILIKRQSAHAVHNEALAVTRCPRPQSAIVRGSKAL